MASRLISLRKISDNLTPYGLEPLSLDEAKQYMQVEGTAYDDSISGFIVAARIAVEEYCNVSITPKLLRAVIRTLNFQPFPLPFLYPNDIQSVGWRRCPSTVIALTENTDWYNDGDGWLSSPTYKGEFTVTYTTEASYDGAMMQAMKAIVRMMYDAGNQDVAPMTPEIKALLSASTKRTF